ncbi:MAG TPA: hypothetical protein VM782_10445 [Stellaceae bacterium]|nr:hypothetical protein [Stellaceae bacterium]
MKPFLILGALVALCGCASDTRNEVLASKAAFKACLVQHPQDVKACDGTLAAFQADLAVYQPMVASSVAVPLDPPARAASAVRQNDFALGAR